MLQAIQVRVTENWRFLPTNKVLPKWFGASNLVNRYVTTTLYQEKFNILWYVLARHFAQISELCQQRSNARANRFVSKIMYLPRYFIWKRCVSIFFSRAAATVKYLRDLVAWTVRSINLYMTCTKEIPVPLYMSASYNFVILSYRWSLVR